MDIMSKKAKMLAKLGELYQRDPNKFRALLPVRALGGRHSKHRIWLAATSREIEESGESTNPEQILGSDSHAPWVCAGGASGAQWAQLPCWVMFELKCSNEEIASFMRDFIGTNTYRTDK